MKMNSFLKRAAVVAVGVATVFLGQEVSARDWPVLRTYSGEALRRVKMPLGGIGTGTVSLSGRGSLVDWELQGAPNKGYTPCHANFAPHFAIRGETADGRRFARLLEGPLLPEEYEGGFGVAAANHGFPRFASATFKAAYPFAQVELADPKVPLEVRIEAMNPLVPGDVEASGLPAALLRWRVRNPTDKPIKVSVAGSLVRFGKVDLALLAVPDGATLTTADDVRESGWYSWNVPLDRYWRRFVAQGDVADSPASDANSTPIFQRCLSAEIAAGGTQAFTFVLAWRNPSRGAWDMWNDGHVTGPEGEVGNWYATRFASAEAAARHLAANLSALEAKTRAFVEKVLAVRAPDVVKEAALFNLSTLRSETCFRTADGHFFAFEGCGDREGSCYGTCTHVWGYEHCLVDLWPDLVRDQLELAYGPQSDPATGHMSFRIGLPLASKARGNRLAAADGQMQMLVRTYEYWKKNGDTAWLKKWFPAVRRALAFAWIAGGWDADRDGVMEGCQHNTMDVEYYGPNPQMEFLYLAALEATAAMADACGEAAFAAECRALRARGSAWTEKNLFNGSYYEHRIVPPKGKVAEGIRHECMGAKDLADPDFQLGAGCLVDQLVGDYAARAVGLPPVADEAHARTTLATILATCRRHPDDAVFNNMRDFILAGETGLRMAWYPEDRKPRAPFPYYQETMTGFEYVVAANLAQRGDFAAAEQVVRDIRDRYDGVKRNPFDEAECGHHYARALAAWSVLKAFEGASAPDRRLTVAEYRERMEAAWLGQMIGVSWGAPVEFKFNGRQVPSEKIPSWADGMINGTFEQDDLYVEMTFLRSMEEYGIDVTIRQAGIDFANSTYLLWHANAAGRRNLRAGIAPPASSHPAFNECANDIDYQIEADYSGILAPGLPQAAVSLGEKFGRLMNYGDGVYGGQFVGAMYAEAFFEKDPEKIVRRALRAIPAKSRYAEMVRDVLGLHARHPADFDACWQAVADKYAKDAGCGQQGLGSGINATLNGAQLLMGLLYGEGDIAKTCRYAIRGGWDTDCNASSACGVLCTALGKKATEAYAKGLKRDVRFSYTNYSFDELLAVSEKLARALVVRFGGRIEKTSAGETFVLLDVAPTPSVFVTFAKPGPVEGGRYTQEEMDRILYQPFDGTGLQMGRKSVLKNKRMQDPGGGVGQ